MAKEPEHYGVAKDSAPFAVGVWTTTHWKSSAGLNTMHRTGFHLLVEDNEVRHKQLYIQEASKELLLQLRSVSLNLSRCREELLDFALCSRKGLLAIISQGIQDIPNATGRATLEASPSCGRCISYIKEKYSSA